MQVRVLFFGVLRDLAGNAEVLLDLPDDSTVATALAHLEQRFPSITPRIPSLACAVNQEFAARSQPLRPNDELGLLPPVSGGSEEQARCALTREPIAPQPLIASIRHPEDGAIAIFEGIVRNHSRGRHTSFLDYQAYEPMALSQLELLAQQARQKFAIRDAAIVHRLGKLQIGETSVLIVVASAHRAAAFDACRWIIDTLKKTVPIWKKEHFVDGAVWAEGDPFPAEIALGGGTATGGGASK